MTLLELMTVVALIGILTSMSGVTVANYARSARVNGAGKTLAAMLAGARVRAVTTQCPYLVQLNGPLYTGPAAGADAFPTSKARMFMFRKANCASANQQYEAGDPVVDSEVLGAEGLPTAVNFIFPLAVLPGGTLSTQSVVIGFNTLGGQFLGVDGSASGEGNFTPNGNVPVNITIQENQPTPQFSAVVSVPAAGVARFQ